MFFDPITLSIAAGAVSLGAGLIKSLKDYLMRKASANVTIQHGDKKIVVSGLSEDELKKVIDNFNVEVGSQPKTQPASTPTQH
jgi:ribosomal protein L12E/L44/L45/RPP1/RPP2